MELLALSQVQGYCFSLRLDLLHNGWKCQTQKEGQIENLFISFLAQSHQTTSYTKVVHWQHDFVKLSQRHTREEHCIFVQTIQYYPPKNNLGQHHAEYCEFLVKKGAFFANHLILSNHVNIETQKECSKK